METNEKKKTTPGFGAIRQAFDFAGVMLLADSARKTIGSLLSPAKPKGQSGVRAPGLGGIILASSVAGIGMRLGAQGLVALGEGLEKFMDTVKSPKVHPEQPEASEPETEDYAAETASPAEEPIEEETPAEEPIAEEPTEEEAPIEEPIAEEPTEEEAPIEEPIAEEPVAEDYAVETMAPAEEPVAKEAPAEEPIAEEAVSEEAVTEPVAAEPVAEESESDAEESEDTLPEEVEALEFIDVMEEPERYREMQEREELGQVRLVARYRRSFESRLIQSKESLQTYYNGIKNTFFRYKGVKGRVSWSMESFNQGRNHVGKVDMKRSTLYLYLALNPAELGETKYEVLDVSDKKKFATVPALIKIRGERKYKYALELIDKLCGEQMTLPPNKKFEETDYRRAYQSLEELVESGLIRMQVAEIPVTAEQPAD